MFLLKVSSLPRFFRDSPPLMFYNTKSAIREARDAGKITPDQAARWLEDKKRGRNRGRGSLLRSDLRLLLKRGDITAIEHAAMLSRLDLIADRLIGRIWTDTIPFLRAIAAEPAAQSTVEVEEDIGL